MNDVLRQLLAEGKIVAVAFRYARALDTRGWEALTSCFRPGAGWRAPETMVRGHNAIRAKAQAVLSGVDTTQHFTGDFEVDLAQDRATLRSYYIATHVRRRPGGGEQGFVLGGVFEDELQRTSTGWRIGRRTLKSSWSDGDPAVIGGAST